MATIVKWKRKEIPFRLEKGFIDRFPEIPGTTEEKMIYNALALRRIPFYFQYSMPDIPFTPEIENWRVDFWLPDYNIIIEMYGTFWHMLPGRIESDAWRISVLRAAGYQVLIWWDFEIHRDINLLFASVPEFNPPMIQGEPYPVFYTWKSDVESIRRFAARKYRHIRVKEAKKEKWERMGTE